MVLLLGRPALMLLLKIATVTAAAVAADKREIESYARRGVRSPPAQG